MKRVLDKALELISQFPKIVGIIIAFLIFVIGNMLIYQRENVYRFNNELQMSENLERIERNIQDVLAKMQDALFAISFTVYETTPEYSFDTTARAIKKKNPFIHNIILMPNGIIKYIYPNTLNTALINRNILKDSNDYIRKSAERTLARQKVYFIGPFKNADGDSVVAGRMPIFINNKFWGFSAVSIRLNDIITLSHIPVMHNHKYDYAISQMSPVNDKEIFFFNHIKKYSSKYTIPEINWNIYITQKTNLINPTTPLYFLGVCILSILIGVMAARLINMPAKLNKMVDEKTAELERTESKFKTTFDNAPIGLAIIDYKTLSITEVNKKFCELAGKDKNFFSEGYGLSKIIPAKSYSNFYEQFKQVVEGKKKYLYIEYQHQRDDLTSVWTHVNVASMPGEHEQKYLMLVEDITDAKISERRLQYSESRFKSVFDNAPIALAEIDYSQVMDFLKTIGLIDKPKQYILKYLNSHPEIFSNIFRVTRLINTNQEFLLLHGVNKKENLTETNFANAEFIKTLSQQLAAMCNHEVKFSGETIIQNTDGKSHNILVSWIVLSGYEHNYEHVIYSIKDVTKIKESEKELKKAKLRLENTINAIDGILWTADPGTSEITFVSEKIEELGYNQEKILGKKAFINDIIHVNDRESMMAQFTAMVKSGRSHAMEYRAYTPDNEIKWFRDNISFVKDNGKIISILGVMVDVSDSKYVQQKLEETSARMQLIIDNIDGIVWTADPETLTYSFISNKAKKLTGYTREEWLNKPNFAALCMSEGEAKKLIDKCKTQINSITPHNLKYKITTKTGEVKWFRESIDYIKNEKGKVLSVIGIMVDITTLQNSKNEISKSHAILSEQNKRLMNFSYIVSHNLRSHTSNILSLSNLIMQTDNQEEIKPLLQYIHDISNILSNTIEGLNEVVNIHTIKEIKTEELNLKNVIDYTIEVLRKQIIEKSATVLNNIDENIYINYNKSYLESIIFNFISNAIKYSSPDRKPLVNLNFKRDKGNNILSISDNGIGIDLEKNGDKLFGLFKTFNANPDSKGIGLYISKNQIEAMGGHVEVKSQVNVGTTFEVYII